MNALNFTPAHALHELQEYRSAEALTPALSKLCSHYGQVKKMVVLTAKHEGAQQAICFLRLETEDSEQALIQALGVERFGEEVVIVVNLEQTEQSHERLPSFNWRGDSTGSHQAFQPA